MKSRFQLVVFVVSAALFVFSCSHFVNLGDEDAYSADNDYTEGLPDEISEDRGDTAESDANYDDWNEDYSDTGYDENEDGGTPEPADPADPTNTAEPTEEPTDWVDTDATDTENSAPYNDEDNEMPEEDLYVFPESGDPFPEGFSNVECGCGSAPDYAPVCCDSKISVFNACFANCYAFKSGNKICFSYETGLCSGTGIARDLTEGDDEDPEPDADADEDNENDADTELPDEDAAPAGISNECGCYPEDEAAIFECGGSLYFVTECLATCHCDDPQRIFF